MSDSDRLKITAYDWIKVSDLPKFFEKPGHERDFSIMVHAFEAKYPKAVKYSKKFLENHDPAVKVIHNVDTEGHSLLLGDYYACLRSDYLDKFQQEYNLKPFTQDSIKTDDWLSITEIKDLVYLPYNHPIVKKYPRARNKPSSLAQAIEDIREKYPDKIVYKFGKNGRKSLCVHKDFLDNILKELNLELQTENQFVSAVEILRMGFVPVSRLHAMMRGSNDDIRNAIDKYKALLPKDATRIFNRIQYFNFNYVHALSELSGIEIKQGHDIAFKKGVLQVLQMNGKSQDSKDDIER